MVAQAFVSRPKRRLIGAAIDKFVRTAKWQEPMTAATTSSLLRYSLIHTCLSV